MAGKMFRAAAEAPRPPPGGKRVRARGGGKVKGTAPTKRQKVDERLMGRRVRSRRLRLEADRVSHPGQG
ncbi:MAG TPA: hypothetical protein VK852_10820 [Desulfobacterales bacterium]|nr:hypothetical protein [Desulfobacterales bacterium]